MIVFHEQLVLPDMLPVKLHLAHIRLLKRTTKPRTILGNISISPKQI